MTKPITYIIVRSYFMADILFEAIADRSDVVIVHHKPVKGLRAALLKPLRMALGNRRGMFSKQVFFSEVVEGMQRIRPQDRVILWGVENFKYTAMMAREIASPHIVSFLWNPMKFSHSKARKYARRLKSLGVTLCTFDPRDSKMLGCALVNQVYSRIEMPDRSCGDRIFFVGCEKGREGLLSEILQHIPEGVQKDISIIRAKHHTDSRPELEQYFTDSPIGYSRILDRITRATAMIDLAQPGQEGVTLRTLEAMFYGKKLVTTNAHVCELPFYHPSRIFIYGDPSEHREIEDFFSEPFLPINPDLLNPYDIRYWLDNTLRLTLGE